MIQKIDSTEVYSDYNELYRDILPHVDGVVGAVLKDFDHLKDDCKQIIFVYCWNSMEDKNRLLKFQHIVNKIWWKTLDFLRRDKSVSAFKKSIPFYSCVPELEKLDEEFYRQHPTLDDLIDVDSLFRFSEATLSEKEHAIFLLSFDGLFYSDISTIMGGMKTYSIRKIVTRTRKKMYDFLVLSDSTEA